MPANIFSDTLGVDDAVRLELGGDTVLIAEAWNIRESVLSQPAQWALTLGWSDVAAGIIDKYPPRTPFKLYIGSTLQFQGRTDGYAVRQPSADAGTTIEIHGRDSLAPLHDSYVDRVTGANVSTYEQLVWFALGEVGIVAKNSKLDTKILKASNVANRQIKAGVPIAQILPHRTVQEILDDQTPTTTGSAVYQPPSARLNETWHRFLRTYLDRAGLMLWAAADGTFVLAAPSADQAPTYQLIRRRGDPTAGGNVVSMNHENIATHRHSEAIIYGRGGGKILGRVKSKGQWLDNEMVKWGYEQPIVFRDPNVKTTIEAAYFASRKIAEERRAGWKLEYVVAGHTLPYLPSAGAQRAVIVPDTVVAVQDDELGIDASLYVETVERRRGPDGTTTTMHLMRPQDLVFGGPGSDE